MRINGTVDYNNQEVTNFKNISDFIETFGTIKYTVNNEEKEMKTKIKEVIPLKSKMNNIYYFEVYEDIKNASKITLVLTFRNNKYEYVLKG